MKPACSAFRAELERRLSSAHADEPLAHLGWHQHLLSCSDCRALLAAEEALEDLLASLPDPRLPRRLADRLLVRLRAARAEEHELDALLALDATPSAPPELSVRVTAGLKARFATEEARLDALLDRDRVDAPAALAARVKAGVEARRAASEAALDALLDRDRITIPAGLSTRVLSNLRTPVRHLESRKPAALSHPLRLPRWALAAAALVLVLLAAWRFWPRARTPDAPPIVHETTPPRRATEAPLPDPNVLAALDVLEQWELLMKDDVDVLLSTIAPADESLLEVEGAPVDAPPVEADEPPEGRKG